MKCLLLVFGAFFPATAYANGFVSSFQKIQYEQFVQAEKAKQAIVEEQRMQEEQRMRAEELRRREEERAHMEQQVVQIENYQEPVASEAVPVMPVDKSDRSFAYDNEPLPAFDLQGIYCSGEMDQAIIGGKVYGVSDKINKDTELLSILKDKVVLRYRDKTIDVPIPMMTVTTKKLESAGAPATSAGSSWDNPSGEWDTEQTGDSVLNFVMLETS